MHSRYEGPCDGDHHYVVAYGFGGFDDPGPHVARVGGTLGSI